MTSQTLNTLLGDYPTTHAIRSGQIKSAAVDFNFADVAVPNTAFKRVVRDLEFDVAELAIVTYLMAKARGVPMTLLPAVVVARFQHPILVHHRGFGALTPKALEGKRVGIRSHTVTTVIWIRAILANDYGVDLNRIQWVTFEDAHVEGVEDPAEFIREESGQSMLQLLQSGAIDAAVMPAPTDQSEIQPVIPDPQAASSDWYSKHGAIQINHLVAVKTELAREQPQLIEELYRLLLESRDIHAETQPKSVLPDMNPFGIETNRRNLEIAIDAVYRQGLINKAMSVDELFDDIPRSILDIG